MPHGRRRVGSWIVGYFVALTAGLMTVYVVAQQIERMGANEPQVQLAEDAASALAAGRSPSEILPPGTRDVAASLSPFVILLDANGQAIQSTGTLESGIPVPPGGVLAAVRANGQERVTWAPRPGLRLAAVVQQVRGAHGGFVVAARSLRETERSIGVLGRLLTLIWLVSVGALVAVAALVRLSPNWPVAGLPEPARPAV